MLLSSPTNFRLIGHTTASYLFEEVFRQIALTCGSLAFTGRKPILQICWLGDSASLLLERLRGDPSVDQLASAYSFGWWYKPFNWALASLLLKWGTMALELPF